MQFRHLAYIKESPLFKRFWQIVSAVSVRTKIMGIILGLVLLLGLGIIWQIRSILDQSLIQQLKDQGVTMTHDLAARATDLILLNDLYALQRLLVETQTNNPNVRYAFILDQHEHVLANTFGNEFPERLAKANSVIPSEHYHIAAIQTEEGYLWDTAVPIFDGRAGTARIGLTEANIHQAIQNITVQLLIVLLVVSTIGIAAAALLTWILTRPILELVRATESVGQGDFSQRVVRWADDEIGDLAEAFNHMTSELERTDEIRSEREELRRQLFERVITIQEEERKRIARELHDSTSQSLTSLIVSIKALEMIIPDRFAYPQIRDLRALAVQTLEEVHELAMQLRPQILDDLGLAAALEKLIKEWQVRYKISVDYAIQTGSQRLPGDVETSLYRIVQEALTNTARYALARSISVLIERRDNLVVAVIEDDGIGFDTGKSQGDGHLGLLGMRERAELLDGKLTIESILGKGTSVFVEIPLPIQENT